MAHLHYLIFRSATKRRKKAVSEDTELLNSLKRRHRRATECLRQIVDYLEPKINYTFTDSDRLYLLIHIVHITS